MFRIIQILLLSLFCCCASAQDISGYWEGVLHITKRDSLTIGMLVERRGDSMSVVIDSPDQYYNDIATSEHTWSDSVLTWSVSSLGASFNGRLSEDGQHIEGKFRQGKSFPLTLERGHERRTLNRPQTPHPPYPYTEEDIRIYDRESRYSLINGTLTMPAGTPKALVILITGSGWQDRDETLMGHKPFLVIADHLTRQGYAVFRYDDFPKAVFNKSTTYDFADGVTLILDSLKRRSELAALRTGLLGHSEGSLVAAIVAARDPRVQFIVTLGGVAQKCTDVLLYQLRVISEAEGKLSPQEIDNSVAISARLYQALDKAKNEKQAVRILNDAWQQISDRLTPEEQERYGMNPENKAASIMQMCSPWFFAFIHFNPKGYLRKVKCPFLALGGEKDLQVDAVANNLLFEKYLPKNPKHRFLVIPQANHMLQTCTIGTPDEYGKIEETIKPEVLEIITEWIKGL